MTIFIDCTLYLECVGVNYDDVCLLRRGDVHILIPSNLQAP
jgi:hypothetical protein